VKRALSRSDTTVSSIVTFLKTLTGTPPAALIAEPTPL
jgi:hypothetical protein